MKKLILYCYPKDNSRGCKAESSELRDDYQELQDKGYEDVGVSPDDENRTKTILANSVCLFI